MWVHIPQGFSEDSMCAPGAASASRQLTCLWHRRLAGENNADVHRRDAGATRDIPLLKEGGRG